jgi:TonB family protein
MFRGERSRPARLLFLMFLFVCPSLPSRAQTGNSKLDTLAARLMASAAGKIPGSGGPGKVTCVVLDFREDEGAPTRLGVRLADEFSQALARKASGITVLDRATLHGDVALASRGGSRQGLEHKATSYAHSVGAEIVVTGNITKQRDILVVDVRFVDASGEGFAEASQRLERTQGLRALEKLPPRDAPPTEDPPPIALPALPATPGQEAEPARGAAPSGPWPDVPEYGKGTSGTSHCLYCPQPEYTDAARWARTVGTVRLYVLIGDDGRVRDVIVERGLPDGLTEKAMTAVKTWRFKPFRDSYGKAMAVKLHVDVTFDLLRR